MGHGAWGMGHGTDGQTGICYLTSDRAARSAAAGTDSRHVDEVAELGVVTVGCVCCGVEHDRSAAGRSCPAERPAHDVSRRQLGAWAQMVCVLHAAIVRDFHAVL